MRTIELSNHPAKLRKSAEERRLAEVAEAQEAHERDLAVHGERVEELGAQREAARRGWRLLRWLGLCVAVWWAEAQEPRAPRVSSRPSADEAKSSAGMEGEQRVANHFGLELCDEWALVRGYRNRAGEIDQILVGPGGVVAIEIKYRNARVGCEGDEWWYDKYDRWGNHVEQGRLVDRGGRSPSRQLNEPANVLEEFLSSRGWHPLIDRVVLFTHARSALGDISGQTVGLIATSPEAVIERYVRDQAFLSESDAREIERLIVEDHRSREPRRAPMVGGRD